MVGKSIPFSNRLRNYSPTQTRNRQWVGTLLTRKCHLPFIAIGGMLPVPIGKGASAGLLARSLTGLLDSRPDWPPRQAERRLRSSRRSISLTSRVCLAVEMGHEPHAHRRGLAASPE